MSQFVAGAAHVGRRAPSQLELLVVGLDHTTADVDLRERVAFTDGPGVRARAGEDDQHLRARRSRVARVEVDELRPIADLRRHLRGAEARRHSAPRAAVPHGAPSHQYSGGRTPRESLATRRRAAMARRLIATLQTKQQAPKTIKNVLGSLHSIFDDALRNGWVVENPCRLVEKPDMSTVPMELHLLARVTTCTTPWVEGALTPA